MTRRAPATDTQAEVTVRYDRIARCYDVVDRPMDLLGGVARRRRRLLARARGATLEVGVGTGRNLDVYPPDTDLTGIDTSSNMLARARKSAGRLGVPVRLELADVQRLPFADATFDTVVATCVFCSVADPVAGLREAARVVRPGGQVLLLEHVRPRTPLLGWLFDLINPIVRRTFGPNINRRTEENIEQAGLDVAEVRRWGIWREIVAEP
ncbi:MAG: methyltransferase domain-containing protein [Ilumatobacter fluminis]|uniref:class I SAM-dependent methyltransferase n=1 Tax=Ilumatobacter fluminis TaxID=467091 RepID=UPI0032F00F4F